MKLHDGQSVQENNKFFIQINYSNNFTYLKVIPLLRNVQRVW